MIVLLSAVVLSLAVAGGLLLGVLHARRIEVPFPAGLAHAGVAIAGIALLLVGIAVEEQAVAVNTALFLFAIAAIGGVFVLLFRLQHERPPMFMVALHGGTAILGLAVLWIGLSATA